MELTEINVESYEKVVRARDPKSGLHSIIAIHDLTLGPSLGGLRMWPYKNEDDALTDVLRLANNQRGCVPETAYLDTGAPSP